MTEPDLPGALPPSGQDSGDAPLAAALPPPVTRTPLHALDRLLKQPGEVIRQAQTASDLAGALQLALGACAIYFLYGLSAGCFEGGVMIAVSALKLPGIVLGSYLLCLPSLYVFSCLLGSEVSLARLCHLLAASAGIAALFLVGLAPVVWLFSVSTRSQGFMLALHLGLWAMAAVLALRFLHRTLLDLSDRRVLWAWFALLLVVCLQLSTVMRPVVFREKGEGLVADRRQFFAESLRDLIRESR